MSDIPEPIKGIFEKVKKKALGVQLYWKIYNDLFNHSKLRTDMLNECAPAAFFSFKVALETVVLMSLSRLTDEPGKGNRQRLSFEKLHKEITKSNDDGLSRALNDKIEDIRERCGNIRNFRNKHLAHLDFKSTMDELPSSDPVTIKVIKEAIEALNDYMSTLEQYYEPEIEVKYGVSFTVNGNELAWVLKNGLRLQELVDEEEISDLEFQRGKWSDA